VLPAVTP